MVKTLIFKVFLSSYFTTIHIVLFNVLSIFFKYWGEKTETHIFCFIYKKSIKYTKNCEMPYSSYFTSFLQTKSTIQKNSSNQSLLSVIFHCYSTILFFILCYLYKFPIGTSTPLHYLLNCCVMIIYACYLMYTLFFIDISFTEVQSGVTVICIELPWLFIN